MSMQAESSDGGQHAAVRPAVPVVPPPRQVERPLAGRRARGERAVGPRRAAGREMPAGAREPARHHGHVPQTWRPVWRAAPMPA